MQKWIFAPLALCLLAAGPALAGPGVEQVAQSQKGESAGGGQSMAEPSNEEVRQAQTALRNMGLYKGKVDGLYGQQTIAAIKEFQSRQQGLARTGALNDQTLQQLQSQAGNMRSGGGGQPQGKQPGMQGGTSPKPPQ